jgi:hypothetical protein
MTKGCLTTALSTWDPTLRLRMKCTAVGRAQDRSLRILSNIGKQIFCARWRSEVLLATSQCTIVDLRSNIFLASADTSSRFSFSVAIKDDSSREASFRIDREYAQCLHPGIAPFKTGDVGKAPGTANRPTPAFSARRFGMGWRALKRQGS